MMDFAQTIMKLLGVWMLCLPPICGVASGQTQSTQDKRTDSGSPIVVYLESRAGFDGSGPVLPSIGFQVVKLGEGPLGIPLASGTTDEFGQARVSIPAGAWEASGAGYPLCQIYVRHQNRQVRSALRIEPRAGESSGPFVLPVVFGHTVVGSTEATDGRRDTFPLELFTGNGDTIAMDAPALPTWTQAFGGWFLVHFKERFELSGRGSVPGVGTAQFDGIPIDGAEVPPIRVVYKGAGILRGQVLNSEKEPIADVPLYLHRMEGDGETRPLRTPGLAHATVWTDVQGRFERKGLRPGRYVPREPEFKSRNKWSPAWLRLELEADGREHSLVIRQATIEIELRGKGGRPWFGAANYDSDPQRLRQVHGGAGLFEYPTELELLVLPVDGEPGNRGSLRKSPGGTEDSGARRFVFDVDPGVDYWVGALGAGFPPKVQRVRVPDGGGRQKVTLQQAEMLPMGTLQVSVLNAEYPNDKRRVARTHYSIEVRTHPEGVPILERDARLNGPPGDPPSSMDLPCGLYQVITKDRERTDFWGSGLPESPLASAMSFADDPFVVEVWEGEPTWVQGVLDRPGTLILSSASASSTPTVSETAARFVLERLANNGKWYALAQAETKDGRFDPLDVACSGEHRLVVTGTDGSVVRLPVAFYPGETTEVTATFP